MNRTLSYRLRATPQEILDIAVSRMESRPGALLSGDTGEGTLRTRSFSLFYTMHPVDGETELVIDFMKTPPVPWGFIKTWLDKEAKKW